MGAIKVAVVDDHKLFRDGVVGLIRGFSGYTVVIEADDGLDFIRQLSPQNLPDLVLLDVNMKRMDGFETAKWLKDRYPAIKILALSMYENESIIVSMMKLGARGYLLKDIRKKELEQALSSLVSKGYYYTEMITGKLIHAINGADDTHDTQTEASYTEIASLNEREKEFLKLACSELTYKDIAMRMHLSVHTIDGYRDALFEKLKIKSRVGLAIYAVRNKIVFVD